MKKATIRMGSSFYPRPAKFLLSAGLSALFLCCSITALEAADAKATAETLLSFKGLRPGLCVHIGGADGELLTELAVAGKYHVHCLTSDRKRVATIRKYAASRDLYGQVVVDYSPLTRLPYPSNLLNVLVVEDFPALQKNGLTVKEMMRVVAPKSAFFVNNAPADLKKIVAQAGFRDAVIHQKGTWTQIVKPWPEGMDEWAQPEHDAGRSSISSDRLIGSPNSVQWIAGDAWRHEASPKPVISKGGRIFASYSDKGLVACDAFNGLTLWQRKGVSALIATGDVLFAKLMKKGTLVSLDARTGETLQTYDIKRPKKSWPPPAPIVYHDGVLLAGVLGTVEAYDAKTGKELWRKSVAGERGGRWKAFRLSGHQQETHYR